MDFTLWVPVLTPRRWPSGVAMKLVDCCCLWVKRSDLLVNALSTNPEYLRNQPSESDSVVDYKDWQLGTGRRFKSLRLWLVLRSYGVANIQSHIRSDVRMARMFEGFVNSDLRFEVVVPSIFTNLFVIAEEASVLFVRKSILVELSSRVPFF